MKARILIVLALMLGALFPVAVSATPSKVANFSLLDGSQAEKLATLPTFSGPCAPGAIYESACDVDHDGDVDIFDIQLSAGRWGQTGTWMSDNDHNHLGQTWTGANNPLVLDGIFNSWPDAYAPLELNNPGGNGMRVISAGDNGIYVLSAGLDGVRVISADDDGMQIISAVDDGVIVDSAGGDGFQVSSATDDGVDVGSAGDNGVYVDSAGGDGIFVCATGGNSGCTPSPSKNGVEIGNAENFGVYVRSTGGTGVYVDSAGINGVYVYSAVHDGVYANTTDANHEWGLYTPDKISGSNVTISSVTVIAQVTGEQALSTGDVVAAVGVTDPLPDSIVPLALVRLADTISATGIVGVVEGRMALTAQPQREAEEDQEPVMELRSAEGPAQPGDYVALTVLGVAQVKVQDGASIQPGQRLTASEVAGSVRALRTETLNGMVVSEGAPVIGTALAAPEPGKDTIPVFVTLR